MGGEMGLIAWLVAVGCMFIGAAVGLWGVTEVNKTLTIWIVGFPGAILLVVALGFELQAVAKQNDVKIEKSNSPDIPSSAVSDQRPWVEAVNIVAGPLIYDEQGGRLGVTAQIKNTGKTPATHITLNASVYLIGQDQFDVLGEHKKFCDEVRVRKTLGGETLFKDRIATLRNSLPIVKADIERFSHQIPGAAGKFIVPILVGCIDYTSSSDQSRHQTGFAYMLGEGTGPATVTTMTIPSNSSAAIPTSDGDHRIISPDRGDVPSGKLSLTPWGGGGFFID